MYRFLDMISNEACACTVINLLDEWQWNILFYYCRIVGNRKNNFELFLLRNRHIDIDIRVFRH